MIKHFLVTLGTYKDGVMTFLAIFAIFVGFFQYLEFRADTRVKYAVELLERREKNDLLNSEVEFSRYWKQRIEDLSPPNGEFTRLQVLGSAADDPKGDYGRLVTKLSIYYNSIASCALNNICDRTIICSSMAGSVQRYLRMNTEYFRVLADTNRVAAQRLSLSLPEFVELCIGEDYDGEEVNRASLWSKSDIYLNGVRDDTLVCRISLRMERTLGLGASFACNDNPTGYHDFVFGGD
ncbi:MAG: hypothetical protein AB8B94_08490 [Hyphomicrobiales bacterium]